MEDTLVASYLTLIVGYLILDNKEHEATVRDLLPDKNFAIMVGVLKKFFTFMNLTASVSEWLGKVLEALVAVSRPYPYESSTIMAFAVEHRQQPGSGRHQDDPGPPGKLGRSGCRAGTAEATHGEDLRSRFDRGRRQLRRERRRRPHPLRRVSRRRRGRRRRWRPAGSLLVLDRGHRCRAEAVRGLFFAIVVPGPIVRRYLWKNLIDKRAFFILIYYLTC